MGGTWEVSVWDREYGGEQGWIDRSVYRGNSFVSAAFSFLRVRRKYGCVTIRYRNPKP